MSETRQLKEVPESVGATLGLRLGLMAAFLMLGIPPLIRFYVAYRLNEGTDDVLYQLPFDIWSILNGAVGMSLLIVIIMTCCVRSPLLRRLLQFVVVLTMVVICIEAAVRYFDTCETCVLSPADDVLNQVFRLLIPVQLLVAVYTVWYLNREPSREFFKQS